ncbi:hypothetical protein [Ilumatobacter sp.]|uniref:hypothetical protein n=1 Tax=Ilumatobacter sp. TaxID=1967498 RepID=UPI003B5177AE
MEEAGSTNSSLALIPPEAVRLFFATADGQHRHFLYFRGRGDDIYWGVPGRRSVYESTSSVEGTSLSATVGDELTTAATKVSYHASGQVHIKADEVMSAGGPMKQPAPSSLKSPLRAGFIITKPPLQYEPYRKRVPRDASCFVHVDGDSAHRRMLIDLFFAPPGKHSFPALAMDYYDRPPDFALTVAARLFVIGWVQVLGAEASEWHPDKSLLVAGRVFSPNALDDRKMGEES